MSSRSNEDERRWSRLETLFDRAVDLPEPERDPFLTTECGDDQELLNEVKALLAANDTGGFRVQNLIRDVASQALAKTATSSNQIGQYELLSAIGNGGMGAVYLAERTDAEFEQRVAIKLLHKTMVTPELEARFRSERQILADLNHPNIAHLIDGGTTDDGVPYIVMEYVEGKPINQYCDDNQLGVPERLDLFRQVCSAIEMAHQNLIVHRDIKPNNILVARDGTPKLLDFGIAKSLTEMAEGDNLTQLGDRILTPNHASPEQVAGKPITTASDIYSLGVLLYELLCGVCPFDLNRCSPAEMERIITQMPAEPPSKILRMNPDDEVPMGRPRSRVPEAVAMDRGTTIDRLHKTLSGDLDNIALLALHKDRDRRYRSVGRLSEDVSRYLRGQPVAARADSWRYRAGKFIQRNRWTVVAATAFLVSIVAFSLVTSFQAVRLSNTAQNLANKNRSLEATQELLTNLLLAADPLESQDGSSLDILDVLDNAALRLTEGSIDLEPLDLAKLQETLGKVYYRLERTEDARDFLGRALAIRERIAGARSSEVVRSLVALGNLELDERNLDDAGEMLLRALDIARGLSDAPSEELAMSQAHAAIFYRLRDDREKAEALYRESVDTYEKLGPQFDEGRAAALRGLGLQLFLNKNYQLSIKATEQALAIDERIHGPKHTFVAIDLGNLALVFHALQDLERTKLLLERALEIHTSRLKLNPDLVATVGGSLRGLGRLYEDLGEFELAMHRHARSLVLMIDGVGENSFEAGKSRVGLARSLQGLGRTLEAERMFATALINYERAGTVNVRQWAELLQDYGEFLSEQRRYDEAQQMFTRAVRQFYADDADAVEGEGGNWQVATAMSERGAVNIALGRFDAARIDLERANEIFVKTNLPVNHPARVRARTRLESVGQLQRELLP